MGWQRALRTRLLDDAAVVAATGTHPTDGAPSIDWATRRQGAAYPAIVLETVSDGRPQTHDGFDSIRPSRVQVNCMAMTHAAMATLRDAVIAALTPAGEFGGVWFDRARVEDARERGGQFDATFVHRCEVDFIFWHKG